jgi:hypothetical protein
MGRNPVAVVILHITHARTMEADYSSFSEGRATWEACSGNFLIYSLTLYTFVPNMDYNFRLSLVSCM